VEHAGYGCPTAPAEIAGMGDTDTADFSTLAGLMQPARRYTFAELVTIAEDAGLFERLTADRDKEHGLSTKSKATLARVLTRYDRRRATAAAVFRVEGKGHSRRYFLHGPHGPHGVSPLLEKPPFPIKPKHRADHADHAQGELISQSGEPCDPEDEGTDY